MIHLADLPTVNATLNGISFVLLICGYVNIRRGRIPAHKRCMVAAYLVSVLFLASYVTYHVLGEEKRFAGHGWLRPIYFSILITHVILAATVPVLATWTLLLALRNRIPQHRRLARWTLPIWLYVCATGIVVYLMLYQPF